MCLIGVSCANHQTRVTAGSTRHVQMLVLAVQWQQRFRCWLWLRQQRVSLKLAVSFLFRPWSTFIKQQQIVKTLSGNQPGTAKYDVTWYSMDSWVQPRATDRERERELRGRLGWAVGVWPFLGWYWNLVRARKFAGIFKFSCHCPSKRPFV